MEKIYSIASCFWDFRGKDELTDSRFLMATPYPITFIVISYLWFVLKFGPEYMKNRKPFHMGKILVVYNIAQMLISFYIVSVGFVGLYRIGLWNSRCYSETEDFIIQYYYFLVKVTELSETVFFVLRKKQSQVSFLHVYHHTLMVSAVWSIIKYNKTDSTLFLGALNSFVHVVMYAYYGLSVFPALTKYLWWKKYITVMQLVQFCMMFTHVLVSHVVSSCKPAYILLCAVCSNSAFFVYLFGDFYVKSYKKKCKTNNEIGVVGVSSKGDTKNGQKCITNGHKLAAKIN